MTLFTIDPEKCKRDGICVNECPARIIVQADKDSVPSLVEGGEALCINCGHCVAVCPHEAFSLKTMGPGDCQAVRQDLIPGPDAADHMLRARRSIRSFSDSAVSREMLQRLLETAAYAPSGHNFQPVHWLVLEQPAEVQRMASIVVDWMRFMIAQQQQIAQAYHFDRVVHAWENGLDRILRGAPHVVVAHGPKDLPVSQSSCTIALTYLDLAAHSLGLGACWAGYFNACASFYPPMQEALALPEGHQCFGAMMLGYAKFKYHRIPLRIRPRVVWR